MQRNFDKKKLKKISVSPKEKKVTNLKKFCKTRNLGKNNENIIERIKKNIIEEEITYKTRRLNSIDISSNRNYNININNINKKKKHLILNSNFKTLELSDNSNSSTYHSSAKTHLFSEPNLRKYLIRNEQYLIKRKLMNNNNNKHNILFEQNTFNLDRRKNPFFNINENNINNNSNSNIKDNPSYFSYLNLNEKSMKFNQINYNYSGIKNSSPIKILSNNNEINNSSSSFFSDNSKLPNKTLISDNKHLNNNNNNIKDIKEKILRAKSSKSKLNEIKKINMKRLSLINIMELNFFNLLNKNQNSEKKKENNFFFIKNNKKRPKSVSLKRKIISFDGINEISQLTKLKENNNKEKKNENNLNNKINKEERNEKENIRNPLKKNSYMSFSGLLLKKKNNKITSLFKNKLSGKIQKFITYNTSNETDNEISSDEEKKNKSNSFHIKPKISYFSVSLRKLNKSQNLKIIKHKKKEFEKDISQKLNFIEYQKLNLKSNIIIHLNNKLIDIINNCETNINLLEEKSFKKGKNILEYIKEIKKDNKLFHNKQRFERKVLKKNKKIKIKFTSLNKYYITNCIINIYQPLNIYQEIYYNNYLLNNKCKTMNIFKNFKIPNEKFFIRKSNSTKNFIDSINSNDYYFISYNNLPKKDYNYLYIFYLNDYEYNTEFTKKKFTLVNISLIEKVKQSFEKSKLKKKETKFIINNQKKEGTIFKKKESKETEKEKRDIKLLNNSLTKINFYKRKEKKIINNNIKISRLSKKRLKSLKEIELENQDKKDNFGYYNKIQMLSQVNDLKYQIVQNLKNTEIIFFYIKDRNYHAFKTIFEQFKLDSELKDINGNSLLNLAVQSNSFLIVNYLLNIGADVNSQNLNYNSPLHYALSFHNFDIADMLINRGADERLKNISGMTPWQCLDSGLSII